MKHLWGIDLGGTKIEGIVIGHEAGEPEVLARTRIPTELKEGYEHVLQRISGLIDTLRKTTGLEPHKIGFGTPGTIDSRTGTIKNSNSVIYNGKPLHHDLEALLGVPVILENDANCFALAETHFGVVRQKGLNPRVVFGIIMGTGVGGGIVVDGRAIIGRQGIGGEWGHNFLDESGGACYCGRKGCVETVISGTALEKFYHSKTGKKLPLPDIYKNAEEYEPEAIQTIKRLNHFFGKALAQVINILDPDVIVVGGGVGNIDTLYTEGRKEAEQFIFNPFLDTPIMKPELGDSAGVFGAAALTI